MRPSRCPLLLDSITGQGGQELGFVVLGVVGLFPIVVVIGHLIRFPRFIPGWRSWMSLVGFPGIYSLVGVSWSLIDLNVECYPRGDMPGAIIAPVASFILVEPVLLLLTLVGLAIEGIKWDRRRPIWPER